MSALIRVSVVSIVAFSGMYAFPSGVFAEIPEKTVASLCAADENVIFACMTRQEKNASLCASKNLSANEGYLVYRFGRIGQKPELVYPNAPVSPYKIFTYMAHSNKYWRGVEVDFNISAHTYTLYNNYYDNEIHNDMPNISESGVIVRKHGKMIMQAECVEANAHLDKIGEFIKHDSE